MKVGLMRTKISLIFLCLIIIKGQVFSQSVKISKEDYQHEKRLLELRKSNLFKEQKYLIQLQLKLEGEIDSLTLELNNCQDSLYNFNESRQDKSFRKGIEKSGKKVVGVN